MNDSQYMVYGLMYTLAVKCMRHINTYGLWSMLDMSHGIQYTAAKHFEASLG